MIITDEQMSATVELWEAMSATIELWQGPLRRAAGGASTTREGGDGEAKGVGEGMSGIDVGYTLGATTQHPFEIAVQRARAALAEQGFGVLLPCNVVVYTDNGETHIAAVDAEKMLSIVENPDLGDTAADVRGRLEAVVHAAAGD